MGLFLLVFFERLSQLPLNDKWRNQNLDKCVHKLCRVQCNFDRVSSAEINFCVVRVPVNSAVANVLDSHEDVFKFLRKMQGFDFVFEPSRFVVLVGFVQLGNHIAKALNASSQQSAGGSWRKVSNPHRFNKELLHRLRHVFARLDTYGCRIDDVASLPNRHPAAGRAVTYVEDFSEVVARNFV